MNIPAPFKGETAIVAGTGPSLTPESIALCNEARAKGNARIFAANRAYELFDSDVFHCCNLEFIPVHWGKLKDLSATLWTTRPELEGKYKGLNYIEERWEDGLSTDPSYICAHHGTGPQLVNIAYLYGCTRLLLVGWDMRFPGKADSTNRNYSLPRRYLGEDELTQKHWPRTGPSGQMTGLIAEMNTIIPSNYGIDIINCSPNSAMTCFDMMELDKCL